MKVNIQACCCYNAKGLNCYNTKYAIPQKLLFIITSLSITSHFYCTVFKAKSIHLKLLFPIQTWWNIKRCYYITHLSTLIVFLAKCSLKFMQGFFMHIHINFPSRYICSKYEHSPQSCSKLSFKMNIYFAFLDCVSFQAEDTM